ncbi:8-amino-7-oxononanoate synthase [Moraxella sp. FZFQ2102]|uniref:aminotransferase class I/II-fold pyridoxal phosphate-dependent enzyme n=1 Tax=Moraxella sp. FZFQ2102 TaxID=2953752 RepID=UPI00209C5817|nr:8-amino-7-oxononanoate synthase [Moraxella sp. FZFQ2102]USZ15553.1 8-amino-7-oxononanoate synthase [Moraxella sp. FZFQ2102]
MNDKLLAHFSDHLDMLKAKHNHRAFRALIHDQSQVQMADTRLVNLASNDYLGIAQKGQLQEEFLDNIDKISKNYGENLLLTSSSSRLLTGNFTSYTALEERMSTLFGRACLLFNSGYHANVGIIPAICDSGTMILADKLVHASMIDGIRLATAAGAKCVRYQHQNLAQLDKLLAKYQDDDSIHRIVILTESIFSMDGDVTDLPALVQMKNRYDKAMLYIDEAHAIGVCGEMGLGCAEQFGCIDDVELIVGASGKAMASVGGYVICHDIIKDYLINTMRPLIFSTALPPLNIAWTQFVLERIIGMSDERAQLQQRSQMLREQITAMGYACPSASQIVPMIVHDNDRVLALADQMQAAGFLVLGVRPPTVPVGQARLRICLNTAISDDEFTQFCQVLKTIA